MLVGAGRRRAGKQIAGRISRCQSSQDKRDICVESAQITAAGRHIVDVRDRWRVCADACSRGRCGHDRRDGELGRCAGHRKVGRIDCRDRFGKCHPPGQAVGIGVCSGRGLAHKRNECWHGIVQREGLAAVCQTRSHGVAGQVAHVLPGRDTQRHCAVIGGQVSARGRDENGRCALSGVGDDRDRQGCPRRAGESEVCRIDRRSVDEDIARKLRIDRDRPL